MVHELQCCDWWGEWCGFQEYGPPLVGGHSLMGGWVVAVELAPDFLSLCTMAVLLLGSD